MGQRLEHSASFPSSFVKRRIEAAQETLILTIGCGAPRKLMPTMTISAVKGSGGIATLSVQQIQIKKTTHFLLIEHDYNEKSIQISE